MKRIISTLILMILLFLVVQWGFVFFKKGHEVSYQVSVDDSIFEIKEIYQKEYGDTYDILIKNGVNQYSYLIVNQYNKQKQIIKGIEYYLENDSECIYPILENGTGTYLECIKDGIFYTDVSFPNQEFITKIKEDLQKKGYDTTIDIDLNETVTIGSSTVYSNSLITSDIITVWNYKGIEIIKEDNPTVIATLSFDKYENNHGYLVGKYYISPNYLSSKVLEFSSVTIVDIENGKTDKIELGNTLSSDTYINGVIDEKLYYTDPSNLLQIEINPTKKSARLIGSKELGGQSYQGEWNSVNIYDFATEHILFQEAIPNEVINQYSYQQILESNMNYYFSNNSGEVYRVSKNNLDTPILLFQRDNLNNLKVVHNTVYFVQNDTLYSFEESVGITPILKNNELRYNTVNRIDIYRKS